MDAQTLVKAMLSELSITRALELLPGCNRALVLGKMNTPRRVAMFLAQVGEESGSLRYTEEIADGSEYNGRADLGNTQPGDGPRFKGRSFIQITGRSNYARFSSWAHSVGLVNSPDYFINDPEALANNEFAWMGPIWYWTVARSNLNQLADAGDVVTATREINGGYNGLQERKLRYAACMLLGNSLLPSGGESASSGPSQQLDEVDMATIAQLEALLVKHQGIPAADQAALRGAIARGGSLYVQFPNALKNPAAVYRVDNDCLLFIEGAVLAAMTKRYGGPPYVVALATSSNIYKLPIAPGTVDPRK